MEEEAGGRGINEKPDEIGVDSDSRDTCRTSLRGERQTPFRFGGLLQEALRELGGHCFNDQDLGVEFKCDLVQFNVIASNGVGDSKPSDTSPMYYVIGERETLKSLFFLYISFFRPSKTAKEALVPGVYCAELHP